MAAKKKSQVRLAKLIAPALPKGERPRAVVAAQTAIPTWGYAVMIGGFLIGGVGAFVGYAIVMMTRKRVVLVLTGKGVSVVRLGKRPFQVMAAYPLGAVPISDVTPGLIWTRFRLQLPGQDSPVAFQADRAFKTELGYFITQADPAVAEVDPWAEGTPAR